MLIEKVAKVWHISCLIMHQLIKMLSSLQNFLLTRVEQINLTSCLFKIERHKLEVYFPRLMEFEYRVLIANLNKPLSTEIKLSSMYRSFCQDSASYIVGSF